MKEAAVNAMCQFLPPGIGNCGVRSVVAFMQPLLSIFFLLTGCNYTSPGSVQTQADTLYFDIKGDQTESSISKVYGIVSRQQLVVETQLKQGAGTASEFELLTMEGRRVAPQSRRVVSEKQTAVFVFEPLHAMKLFQTTGLRGDIQRSYKVQETIDGKVTWTVLEANEAGYLTVLDKFGLAANTVPLAIDVVTMNDLQEQHAGVAIDGPVRSDHVTESEILSRGLWIKVQAYHRFDTLFVSMRLVNQTNSHVSIDPSIMTLSHEGMDVSPLDSPPPFVLPNGKRASFDLKYSSSKSQAFEIDLGGIKTSPSFFPRLFLKASRSYHD